MNEKYLIIKKDNAYVNSKRLEDSLFEKLRQATLDLENFNYISFLSNSYVKAKEEFLTYDFSQFNVREVDMFNVFLNALDSMTTNGNLWNAYLKRNYADDVEMYSIIRKGKKDEKRYCFAIKDSEYYDKNVVYVVAKVLRNMIAHHCKPYSQIIYYDDFSRHFIVTKEELLQLEALSKSAKEYISKSSNDYYDIVEVIRQAFDITDQLNVYMFNLIVQKEWGRFINARYIIREHVGNDWQGAYLVWKNPQYSENHLLHLSQINISKNAMNGILSIAVSNLGI